MINVVVYANLVHIVRYVGFGRFSALKKNRGVAKCNVKIISYKVFIIKITKYSQANTIII